MKILFIGNSHTYMNDMPELVREMVENATGKTCEVFMLIATPLYRSELNVISPDYDTHRPRILKGTTDYNQLKLKN